jgi:hypothetical protein
MPHDRDARANRRRFVGATVLAGTALTRGGPTFAAPPASSRQGTPEQEPIGRVEAPAWALTVFVVQDPYQGQIQQPATQPPGTRYVAAEVKIDNASDQPLNFSPAEIRLRDAVGTEYRGGSAIGTEPFLSIRNLNGGERSHGWVWFTVPQLAEIVELAYYGPPPVFRVALP